MATNTKHLDNTEKEIRKARKNFRLKLKTLYDKMEEEFKSFNLIPSCFEYHQCIIYEIWQLQEFLETPESKNDKEEILKVIDYCRTRFKLLTEDLSP